MPDPVVRNSPALYSVPLHFMQEYVRCAIHLTYLVYVGLFGDYSATRHHQRTSQYQ